MGKLHVKNGTPVGNEHLCKRCTYGQFTTGYRESDILAICTQSNPSFRLPFVVHECTDFEDKSRPDWEQMEKLAIQIQPVRVSKKTRGFGVASLLEPQKPEYEPEYEPAVAADEDDLGFEDTDAVSSQEVEDECEEVGAVAGQSSAP